MTRIVITGLLLMASMLATAEEAGDPWQDYNRFMFGVNDAVDRTVLKPVAQGYEVITPGLVRDSIGHFFLNLDDVDNSVNNLLQGKPGAALSDFGRVLINSTFGLGGLFDVASEFGLRRHDEDFGQTLVRWGVPNGPYFIVPFMGPGTVTSTVARPVNSALDPVRYYHPVDHRNVLFGVRFIDERAALLNTERLISGDRYIFVRDAYLQRRNYLINDGKVSDPFADDF